MKAGALTKTVALAAAAFAALFVATTGYPSALKPSRKAPAAVLFDNVRLISIAPDAPQAEAARAVLVIDGKIETVGAAGAIKAPDGALIIDGDGATLMPGLIDAHIHLWDEAELAGYLAHGVTGVRNMSGMPFHVSLARRIAERKILGPDFLSTGPIINSPGPNQQDIHQLVETADEARAAIRKQYEQGFRAVKVYSNLKREAFDAVMDEPAGVMVGGYWLDARDLERLRSGAKHTSFLRSARRAIELLMAI